MAYCTLADLKKAIPERNLIQVTDDEGAGTVNASRVTQAISDADDIIDTYLRGKHTVPLDVTPFPAIIRRISVDLTIYLVYRRRLEFEPTDAMAAMYKEAIRFLEGIRDGKNMIGDPDSVANNGGVFKTNKATTDRVFDSCKLDTF
jgi:phage gp36-like protein